MWRTWLGLLAMTIGGWALINLLVTTDREFVEAEVDRLVALAGRGGEQAVEQILASLAADYTGTMSRQELARYLRRYVGQAKVASIKTGSFKTLWKGNEIVIPILAVFADLDGWKVRLLLTVTWAEREGTWKIVDLTRVRFG